MLAIAVASASKRTATPLAGAAFREPITGLARPDAEVKGEMSIGTSDPHVAAARPPAELLTRASLFLDFDGTLVDLADRPDSVAVSERLRALLMRLAERLEARVALISGRSAAHIRELIGLPALTVAGSHGLELNFADGRTIAAARPEGLTAVRPVLDELAGRWPGVLVEDKPLGSALHFRLRPEAGEECMAEAASLAERHGLHLQTGKMMVELRGKEGDKGTALRRLMEEPEMAGTTPVFVGDDDTDEPAFVAAAELGGAGVLVGPPRPTAARYRLDGVADVLAWLEAASR